MFVLSGSLQRFLLPSARKGVLWQLCTAGVPSSPPRVSSGMARHKIVPMPGGFCSPVRTGKLGCLGERLVPFFGQSDEFRLAK